MKRFFQALWTNILALWAWIFLAFGIFYLVYDSEGLTADVLKKQIESDKQSDLFYTFEEWVISLTTATNFVFDKDLTIVVTIQFDDESVMLFADSDISDLDYSYDLSEDKLVVELYADKAISDGETIMRLPYDGMMRNITMGDVVVYVDGQREQLSIGTDSNFGEEDIQVHY